MELHIALCEDQAEEQARLTGMIQAGTVPAQVTVFSSGEAFLEAFQPGRFDLVFMDIYMGGMTGVEVVRKIRETDEMLPIAFVTTSLEFALEGYRLNVAKYLEKPVTQKAVDGALQLAAEQWEQKSVTTVTLGEKEFSFPVQQLICVEQKGHYLEFSFEGGRVEQIKGRMDDLAPQLAAFPFFRCHKSYLIHLAYITGIDRELMLLRLRDGHDAHVRREDLKKVKEAWENWLFTQARRGR